MVPRGSITAWICRLASDEELAFSRLHQRLWPMLLARARARLKDLPIRYANEEDIAQEAFRDFYLALKSDKIPRLANRHDLLAFLTHETALLDECYQHFVTALGDGLRPFAERHLLGSTNKEMAAAMDCDERTVARKLVLIRAKWSAMAAAQV